MQSTFFETVAAFDGGDEGVDADVFDVGFDGLAAVVGDEKVQKLVVMVVVVVLVFCCGFKRVPQRLPATY